MRNFRPMLSPRFAQMRLLENDRAGASAELRGSLCERRPSKYAVALILALICSAVLFPPAAWAQSVTATVTVGSTPNAVAVNPGTNKVYVANYGSGTVSVIDGATDAVTATVTVGSNPNAVAVNPVTSKIYVANYGSGTMSVIDGTTDTATATVSVGSNPYAVVVNPGTNKVYVANNGSGTVTVIDGATNSTSTVTVGSSPWAIAVNPVTNKVYVANYGNGTVSVIDGATNTVTATVTVGSSPRAIAVNPVTNKVYVANWSSNTVTVINGATNLVTATVNVGRTPVAVLVNPVTNMVYVANLNGGTVTVIDGATSTVTATLTVASAPFAVAVNPVTDEVYVAAYGTSNGNLVNAVTVIDGAANTVTATVNVGSFPSAVAVNPVTNKVYAANADGATVTVIDGATNTTATVNVGKFPYALAVNQVTNKTYVIDNSSDAVTVIDGATNTTATVNVGNTPSAIAMNPVTNEVYVANSEDATVSVIDGATNTVTATVNVGSFPIAVAVNPVTNKVYVANALYSTVTVIDGATNTVTATVNVGNSPQSIAVNPVTNEVYVANNGNVTVIDGMTNATATVNVGSNPWGVAVNPVTNKVYVANNSSDTVSVIDGATNTVTATVNVGSEPGEVAVNPVTNKVYVVNLNSNTVTLIDGATNATAMVTVGNSPYALAVNQVTNSVYVANYDDGTMTAIDGATNVRATVTVGGDPWVVAVNPVTNKVYVANGGGGIGSTVTVITPSTAQSIPLSVTAQGVNDSQTVSGLALFATSNVSPSFTATVTSSYAPTAPAPTALYYQLDTAQGTWHTATATDSPGANPASYSFSLSGVPLGVHTVYVYAVYGDEGTPESSGNGSGNSPEISNITACTFAELQTPTTTTVTADVNPQVVGSNVNFTAYVAADFGTGTPTGMVTFSDSATQLGQVALDDTGHAEFGTASLAAGSHSITVTYGGDANFQASSGSMPEGIDAEQSQTITFLKPRSQIYGATPITLGATATSGLTVSYTVTSVPAGIASVNVNALTITGAGSVTVTANQEGNVNWAAATPVPQTFTVTAAPLTITANNQSKPYGAALPTLTASYAGFVNGDTSASLATPPTLSTAATAASAVGSYPITASGAASPNYSISYVAGTLAVNTAPLTITANNQSKPYGAALPTLTASYAGFVNGDTSASLATAPTLSTAATAASAVGSYPITASGAASPNYSISYVAGTLAVNTAPLTITANNLSKPYGAALPTLTASYAGFVNGDTSASLATAPTLSTAATAASAVGSYPITASGAVAANYSVGYTPGTLAVTAAPLTITANNLSKPYGAALPTLTASYAGFVNGDTSASLATAPTLSTAATAASAVGSYPITASGAVAANYSVGYTPGTLAVTAAPLTITANNQSKPYGAALPSLSASYSGFVNGDTAASLTTQPTVTTTATAASSVPGGPYTITASGAVDPNYSISYAAGSMTINAATLSVAANNASMTYGSALPNLTGTLAGVISGDAITASYATIATSASQAGTYSITATLNDPDNKLTNYSVSNTPGTLTVSASPNTTVLLSGPSFTDYYGQTLGFTAKVSNAAGIPGGTVSFYDSNNTLLGSAPLIAGSTYSASTFKISTLSVGPHTISAVYASTTDYAGAISNSLPQAVNLQTVSINGSTTASSLGTINVAGGGNGSAQFTVGALGTLTAPVSISCSGLPSGLSCQLSSSTINVADLPSTVTVTVSAAKLQILGRNNNRGLLSLGCALGMMLPGILLVRGKRRARVALLLVMLCVVLLLGLSACGSGGHGITNASSVTPAGTYKGTITATSAGATPATTTFTVTVTE